MPKIVVHETDRTWLCDLAPGESVVVGRDAACDVHIDTARASRRHFEIAARGDGHVARDLASTNGTLLNGVPLADEVALADGDVLEAGGCRVTYWKRP